MMEDNIFSPDYKVSRHDWVLFLLVHMKVLGQEPYDQMSISQIKEKANQIIEGRMTRKESLLIAMFTAKKGGYGPYKDMSSKDILDRVKELKNGDEFCSQGKSE